MELQELINLYHEERHHEVTSVDELLDYCQLLYIRGDIEVCNYRHLLKALYKEGAISCHELSEA